MRNVTKGICIIFAVIGAIFLVIGLVGIYQSIPVFIQEQGFLGFLEFLSWLIAEGEVYIVLTLMGGVFLSIPSITFGLHIRRRRTVQYLKTEGKIIHGKVTNIYKDTSYTVQGQNPWRIAVQWVNPDSRRLYVLKSDHIWYDPSEFVKIGEEMEVRIDPKNPKKHWVNIDHLPKRAD